MPARTIIRNTNTALADAIIEAGLAAGMPETAVAQKPKKPTHAVRRDRNKTVNMKKTVGLGWEHPIANLTVSVKEGNCEASQSNGPNTWAKLKLVAFQPKQLNVNLDLERLDKKLLSYVVRDGDKLTQVTNDNLPTLRIPVTWNTHGQPQMRERDVDNCDIILVNDDGLGIQLQVSVVVRSDWNKGKPWWAIYVQLQEMQSLQIVTTTKVKAEELGLTSIPTGAGGSVATVIPLFGYHNRPDTDWLSIKNSAKFGPGLVHTCLEQGRYTQLSNALHESWLEHDLGEPEAEGTLRGRIKFYNMIWKGGAGFIELADGSSISVHWKKLDRSVFALAPEDIVEFTIGEHNGRRQAKNVRVIEIQD